MAAPALEMSHLNKDLVLSILQFLREEGFKESARMLELESGYFFDMKFFEDMVLSGIGLRQRIIFLVSQSLMTIVCSHRKDRAKALDILMNDLKVFAQYDEELFKDMTQLLTLDDFRQDLELFPEHEQLSDYGTESVRRTKLQLQKLIEANPIFRDKLDFPRSQSHSLNWQHHLCTNPRANPDIRTLLVDHVCPPLKDHAISTPTDNNLLSSQSTLMPEPRSPATANTTPPSGTHSAILSRNICVDSVKKLAAESVGLVHAFIVSQNEPNEETSTVTHVDRYSSNSPDDLPTFPKKDKLQTCSPESDVCFPKNVAKILELSSSPKSMDFHPVQQTLLLVGFNNGSVGIWETCTGDRLHFMNFRVCPITRCSFYLENLLFNDPHISVNRVAWSPEGYLFGVAYSKHLVELYSYDDVNGVRHKLQIEAHVGGVNDLAFAAPREQLMIITCGDDKMIKFILLVKAWDVNYGFALFSFQGHDTPVYSLCPQSKESIHFLFSISMEGNIKAWMYDILGPRVNFVAPGLWSTRMAYSSDGRSGEPFLVEWNENEGSIKRSYQGLQKNPSSTVEFDILNNQFLAAGDEHVIKIWDMDKVDLLTTIGADGDLPENPPIRFNKDGTLLAVFANENRINILETDHVLKSQQKSETSSGSDSSVLSDTFRKLAINPSSNFAGAAVVDEVMQKHLGSKSQSWLHSLMEHQEKIANLLRNGDQVSLKEAKSTKFTERAISKVQKLFEINGPSQCQILCLPLNVKANKMLRLTYNNAGNAILGLASNGTHLYWKWPLNTGKANTEVPPQLWCPRSCSSPMTNDLTNTNPEEPVACFALSKNDSYLMSASGGKISIFNMVTFKEMLSIMPPSPAATCVVFYPEDNNIVAIGRDDSTILIYNVRLTKVISKLEGHSKRVSGLCFSISLNVLVSAGEDAQLIVWNTEGWKKQRSRLLQVPEEKKHEALSDTQIQLHRDQIRFLAVHKTHLAIYEAKELECLKQWIPADSVPITQATFSCDSQMVYAGFVDGTICILDASLDLLCRIVSTAYLPPSSSLDAGCSNNVYPLTIAAHPQESNQFAAGLTNGKVIVFEPSKSTGEWNT
ncbi:hypothetical protein Tsubulata_051012 [Turnera subulata]|uniref:LisH domain-containing protein n=1 Tax=Turnera subulata TaxID=218843 RepID=A0A9Q0J5B8_9ROSI|nr:hypothetical protein Tsubulata_051012 [Turnera subulata]